MSIWGSVWNGTYGRDEELELKIDDKPMTESYIRDDSVFYESKMRWNKNTIDSRIKECWECGTETSNFYQHLWRTQDGKVANVKCECCYNKYISEKDICNEND